MASTLVRITSTARRLLQSHKPGLPGYLSWVLGPPHNETALVAVDDAYAELVQAGLMAAQDSSLLVLPRVSRKPFVLTAEGERTREVLVAGQSKR
jgi:hypothetical protein